MNNRFYWFACASLALLGSTSAWAITDLETNSSVPFSFLNPGARSLGMGSAFVGMADDATAAYTNPAGLTQLLRPEFSIEGRRTDFKESYLSGGTIGYNPTDLSGLNYTDAKSTKTVPSFISFVLPRGDFAWAFYRHELTNFSTSIDSEGAYIVNGADSSSTDLYPYTGATRLHIVDYSAALALKANDMLSLGLAVSYYTFKLSAVRNQYDDASFSDGIPLSNVARDTGSDHSLGATLGLRARFNDEWSLGFAYRESPEFKYDEALTGFITYDTNGKGTIVPAFAAGDLNHVKLKVPDVLSLGLSYHPGNFVFNLDVDYVRYAQITDGLQSVFTYTSPATQLAPLHIPNGTEIHLGGEYTFDQMTHPLSVRAGIWHDPRHTIQFGTDPLDSIAAGEAAAFSGGAGGKMHGSLGLGMAFDNFQIDAAADVSSKLDTYSVSAVYRF